MVNLANQRAGDLWMLDGVTYEVVGVESDGMVCRRRDDGTMVRITVGAVPVDAHPPFSVWAWIGEDEFGDTVGLKQGFVPAGCIPLVAVERAKIDQPYIRDQLQQQVDHWRKPIRLVELALVGEGTVIVPGDLTQGH